MIGQNVFKQLIKKKKHKRANFTFGNETRFHQDYVHWNEIIWEL